MINVLYKALDLDIEYDITYDTYSYEDAEGDFSERHLWRKFKIVGYTDLVIEILSVIDNLEDEDIEVSQEDLKERLGSKDEMDNLINKIVFEVEKALTDEGEFNESDGDVTVVWKSTGERFTGF